MTDEDRAALQAALVEEFPPRRLTPTERLHEVTMAFAQRAASPPEHSVTISRNAKGVVQYEVTVRGYDLDTVSEDAVLKASALDRHFPYPSENGGES